MKSISERLAKVGVSLPDIMIPSPEVDLEKWSVVACDQYTSEREYWQSATTFIGDSPSTNNLIFPECYLEDPNPQHRIDAINHAMGEYMQRSLFVTYPKSFFLVHRETGRGPGRWGLMVALDLEQYDFSKDSRSLIRATEGTILSRIPPRKAIRRNAPLELPHIMVLINDEHGSVIEALAKKTASLPLAYETPLMKRGGHLTAWVVNSEKDLDGVASALEKLYSQLDPANPLLFAMGDGNHSLATAKSCWEDLKHELPAQQLENHPARYALVELENIFDPGLEFEPIHRVLFHVDSQQFEASLAKFCSSFSHETVADVKTLLKLVNSEGSQRFGTCNASGLQLYTVDGPIASIAAGTLQAVIDDLLETSATATVDYIHGVDVTCSLGSEPGNMGLLLPDVAKETFFDSIIADNALPRKTFSMGEAHEKRYYMEARKIK